MDDKEKLKPDLAPQPQLCPNDETPVELPVIKEGVPVNIPAVKK